MRTIAVALVGLAAAGWLAVDDPGSHPVWFALATGVLGSVIILAAQGLRPMRWGVTEPLALVWCRGRLVRVSVSYLFRIKSGDKYLLVRSERRPEWGPVGGVYKRVGASTAALQTLGVLDDDCHPIDARSESDLRIRVHGWNLGRFLRWFERGEDRELAPWREFYEELVATGLLPSEIFPFIFWRPLGQRHTRLAWSPERSRFELYVADIFDVVLSEEQWGYIRGLPSDGPTRWATEHEIRARGIVPNVQSVPDISRLAVWVL